jgi:DNA polymerase elongation subunit (family B)
MRGIESRRHDVPNFIKQFQHNLSLTLFDCKNSSEVITKGYENALLVVTQTIDRIMIGEGIEQQDLVISKLLRQAVTDYKSIFPHVAAAIQLSNEGKTLMRGQNIQFIHTDSKHKNPLCRIAVLPQERNAEEDIVYDKEKYLELLLSAAQTVLGYFGFDPTIYGNDRNNNKRRKWWDVLRQERGRDIDAESRST